MSVITTKAVVSSDGTLIAKVPESVKPGEHRITIQIDDEKKDQSPGKLPVISVGEWPENFSTRREDMYGDWGR